MGQALCLPRLLVCSMPVNGDPLLIVCYGYLETHTPNHVIVALRGEGLLRCLCECTGTGIRTRWTTIMKNNKPNRL